jgi:hypothetical protein
MPDPGDNGLIGSLSCGQGTALKAGVGMGKGMEKREAVRIVRDGTYLRLNGVRSCPSE